MRKRKQRSQYNPNLKANLNEAFKLMRKQGLLAMQNYLCCMNCASSALFEESVKRIKNGKEVLGVCYYHRQDTQGMEQSGKLYLRYGNIESKKENIIAKNTTKQVADMVCACLKKVGLTYDWDGDTGKTIIIDMTQKLDICKFIENECAFADEHGVCTQPNFAEELDCKPPKKETIKFKTGTTKPKETRFVKPTCKLVGEDGNVFNLIGIAARVLRKAGYPDKAKEMSQRITKTAKDYHHALSIINEYVDSY